MEAIALFFMFCITCLLACVVGILLYFIFTTRKIMRVVRWILRTLWFV